MVPVTIYLWGRGSRVPFITKPLTKASYCSLETTHRWFSVRFVKAKKLFVFRNRYGLVDIVERADIRVHLYWSASKRSLRAWLLEDTVHWGFGFAALMISYYYRETSELPQCHSLGKCGFGVEHFTRVPESFFDIKDTTASQGETYCPVWFQPLVHSVQQPLVQYNNHIWHARLDFRKGEGQASKLSVVTPGDTYEIHGRGKNQELVWSIVLTQNCSTLIHQRDSKSAGQEHSTT